MTTFFRQDPDQGLLLTLHQGDLGYGELVRSLSQMPREPVGPLVLSDRRRARTNLDYVEMLRYLGRVRLVGDRLGFLRVAAVVGHTDEADRVQRFAQMFDGDMEITVHRDLDRAAAWLGVDLSPHRDWLESPGSAALTAWGGAGKVKA